MQGYAPQAMRLLLLDGNSLAYRAFYALPDSLMTPEGQPTNAVTGFLNMLLRMLREYSPDYVAVAFDERTPEFRNNMYPAYKAQRKETPESLRSQMGIIRELCQVLRLPVLSSPDVEADDIIATLARQAAEAEVYAEIVTGDRDQFQCVTDPFVRVLYTLRGISEVGEMNEDAVARKHGVLPSLYLSLAALRGDPSDNLPGVPGIGDKTAAKLLHKYGSIEGIWAHVEELTSKQRANVKDHWSQVEMNMKIMELRTDLDFLPPLQDLRIGSWDLDEITRFLKSLALKAALERVMEIAGRYVPEGAVLPVQDADLPELALRVVSGPAELVQAARALGPGIGLVAQLPEGRRRTAPLAWAVAAPDGRVVWAPHVADELDAMAPLFTAATPEFHSHAAKEIAALCWASNIAMTGLDIDTEIAAFLVDSSMSDFSLGALSERFLGEGLEDTEAKKANLSLDFGPLEGDSAASTQLGRQAWAVSRLAPILHERLVAISSWELYTDVERPLVGVLARMEETGILLDVGYLADLSEELKDRIKTLEAKIHEQAGREFTVNSPKQLREVLFDEMGLPPGKKTKTGYSTDASTLERLRDEHPIAEALLEYRNLEKLRSTYTDALPPLVDPVDGRLHTRFRQTGAATGRLSSESPNLMNIPIRTEQGRRIRRAFIPAEGCVLLTADYSQIELRVLAHLSQDEKLIEAFQLATDIHAATAARVFGVPVDEVSGEQRSRAKAVNFGLLYGMQAFGLAQRMGISHAEAQELVDTYFARFPSLQSFLDELVVQAKEKAYTTTVLGRRRVLRELQSPNFRIRQMGERMALNAPMQGSAADIMKVAMVRLDAALTARELSSRMLLQVHDELVLEVPEDEIAEVRTLVVEVMENACSLAVPLVVEAHTAKDWAGAKG